MPNIQQGRVYLEDRLTGKFVSPMRIIERTDRQDADCYYNRIMLYLI
jgi:hypothetical protein